MFLSGKLVKLSCPQGAGVSHPCRSVYYVTDGTRSAFPNQTTYFSWYQDFSLVEEVTAGELAAYPLKGNMTIRPGTYLIKLTTDPNVYVVEPGNRLRLIPSEEAARTLYGIL
jgi:hypothetical protein